MDQIQVGVDIGGTFTDFVAIHGTRFVTAKVSSTPHDPTVAVLQGLRDMLAKLQVDLSAITRLAHGTTIATNAAIERKGARVGFICNAGFEDIVEIGRLQRSNIYDLATTPETPIFIAPRNRRVGVPERLGPDGGIVTALDEAAVTVAIKSLVEQKEITSLAVGFLFSYLNPVHERRVRNIVRGLYPALPVSLSSDVDPRFREYERFTTTLFDAYLKPLVSNYLDHLESFLGSDARRRFYVMQSSGGLSSAPEASERPVTLLKSGLAAGVIGACHAASTAGFSDIISVDIGGTSCDVALIKAGRPSLKSESAVGPCPIRIPVVEVSTIGAGGGSIAWLDAVDGLHVGPESAGATPGPACYGLGSSFPTITDASLVLGYISADTFAGGRLKLDARAAIASLEPLAKRLKLTVSETAAGMHRIINATMTDEIRRISLHRGEDPRHFSLLLLGGGGPLHGAALAEDLGVTTLVIPPFAGLLAAYGLLVADVTCQRLRPFRRLLDEATMVDLIALCNEIDDEGRKTLAKDIAIQRLHFELVAQMRYVGQSHELEVALPALHDVALAGRIREEFEKQHIRVFGRSSPDRPIEFTALIATHAARQDALPNFTPPNEGAVPDALRGRRPVYFWQLHDFVDTPVYERKDLPSGAELIGPAIIEQFDTTSVIPPRATARVHNSGALLVTLKGVSQ